jgi:hypothetical protein
MSLADSIDAAFTLAAEQGAEPFRLELTADQIRRLREAGRLGDPVGPKTVSPGAYSAVNVYETQEAPHLLAQPASSLRALYFAVIA